MVSAPGTGAVPVSVRYYGSRLAENDQLCASRGALDGVRLCELITYAGKSRQATCPIRAGQVQRGERGV